MIPSEEAGSPNGFRGHSQVWSDKQATGGRDAERRQNFYHNRQPNPQRGNRRRGGVRGRGGISQSEFFAARGQSRRRGSHRATVRGRASRQGGLKMGRSRGSMPVSQGRKRCDDWASSPPSRTSKAPSSEKHKGLQLGPNSTKEKQNSNKGRGGLKLGPHAPGKSGTDQRTGRAEIEKKEVYDRVEVPADSPYLDTRKYVKMRPDIHSEIVSGFYTERGTGRRKRDVEEEMPCPTQKWPGWPDVSYWSRLTNSPPESSGESDVQE